MTQTISRIAGWLALAFIAFVTLSPIYDRPSIANPQLEHFAAFALLGLALMLGYPRRMLPITVIIIGSAFMLEAMQLLTPDRHGRVLDALVKAVGGLGGIGTGRIVLTILQDQVDRFRKLRGQSAG
ncbi:VanZ family protein [Bradyrhizobium sp. ISRA443]|uniref:VanZ family protein n=1 Tax=unclassified Bradyrhizobium TaxID=2631580 RepID=UPI002478A3D3|nr:MULTISPECIES: VanZ family protein [unclassified Bradyrhizobium]WGR97244.1 VanZ family protein [Bradyrhizobium sp. ISRA436]WGS04133.1 VanZ family protein [Bradyrhizobium sp. ISRA437]WGS11016.1 VanZ family protein [Bradyrhizobium sp. ISRA443]